MSDVTLPNCLTRTPRSDPNMPGWFYLFCANCGAEGGRVMDTLLPAQYAFYLCNDCVEKYGEPAGCTATPDDVFWKKVQDAMTEEYGHVLTEHEIAIELDNPSSIVSTLERDARRR